MKILHIAVREFVATVMTKGFIFGLLIIPATGAVMFALGPRVLARLFNPPLQKIDAEVAVFDPTGQVVNELRARISPEELAARRAETARRGMQQTPDAVRGLAGANADRMMQQAIATALGEVPNFHLVDVAATAGTEAPGLDAARRWLTEPHDGRRRVGFIVVHADAVKAAEGRVAEGNYDFYVPANLDDRFEELLQAGLRDAIISARARALAMDRDAIDALMRVARVRPVEVTPQGERRAIREFDRLLPAAFMLIMFIGVMTGGQGLLVSTVEEKASRVVEVLLSAASPFELMAGKLLGQMAVSFVALTLYVGLGLVMLVSFAALGLVNPTLLVYLVIFFVIAYLVMASMMMSIGAAVNDMREAQSLLTPVMLMTMLPWFLWMPISRDPNSVFSTVMSFLPPLNTFAMLLRLTSSSPPPWWQVWLTIGIGLGSAVAAIWVASKVFRIGLLMHGKPPNLRTLIRWVRAA